MGKRMNRRGARCAGFTLVELMITVAVLAVVAAIAFPSFRGVLQSNQVASTSNEVVATLALARSEAIRSARGSGVCASRQGTACDGAWSDGLMVWSDENGDGAYQPGEPVLRFVAFPAGFEVEGPDTAIGFDNRGRRRGAADALALQPADCASQPYRRVVSLGVTGQLRTTRGDCE